MLLKRLGLSGHHCFSAREAITYCEIESPFLILMDLHMPEMDGLQAVRVLRSTTLQGRTPPIPIVALTADVRSGVREACIAAGMNGFLTKPIRLEDLRSALEKHLPPTAPSAPAPPVKSAIDVSISDSIFEFGDEPELAAEVKIMFHEMWADVEPDIAEIDALRRSGELKTAQARCHRLRGMLASYGFSDAAEQLKKMEFDSDALTEIHALETLRNGLEAARLEILARYSFLR